MRHPAGVQTTDYEPREVYEPTKLQIANAARRANTYHYTPRKSFPWAAVFAIGVAIYGLYWMITN